MIRVYFTQDEYDTLIEAAREAQIRFKRARTELRSGNPQYSHWHEDSLNESIDKFKALEQLLLYIIDNNDA